VALEEELDQIDRDEPRLLFLGNLRRDKNDERKTVISKIDKELESYGTLRYQLSPCGRGRIAEIGSIDALVKRNSDTLCMQPAKQRDITNIRNWVNA
jgi:hypothetical protein